MSILKIRSRSRFTLISNEVIQDASISFAARGLLTYLLSLPENWELNVKDLIQRSPAGRDAVYTLLNELITHGFIKRLKSKLKNGRFSWRYDVYAEKGLDTFEPGPENPDRVQKCADTDIPDLDIPDLDKPDTYKRNKEQNKQENKETAAKTSNNAAAAQIKSSIGTHLTPDQHSYVEKELSKCITNKADLSRVVEQVSAAILDTSCFTKAGNNFFKKLNTIRKAYQEQWWVPDEKLAVESEQDAASAKLHDEISKLESKHKQISMERSLELNAMKSSPMREDMSFLASCKLRVTRFENELKDLQRLIHDKKSEANGNANT